MMKKVLILGLLTCGSAVVFVFGLVASRLHAWDPDDWQGITDIEEVQ